MVILKCDVYFMTFDIYHYKCAMYQDYVYISFIIKDLRSQFIAYTQFKKRNIYIYIYINGALKTLRQMRIRIFSIGSSVMYVCPGGHEQ